MDDVCFLKRDIVKTLPPPTGYIKNSRVIDDACFEDYWKPSFLKWIQWANYTHIILFILVIFLFIAEWLADSSFLNAMTAVVITFIILVQLLCSSILNIVSMKEPQASYRASYYTVYPVEILAIFGVASVLGIHGFTNCNLVITKINDAQMQSRSYIKNYGDINHGSNKWIPVQQKTFIDAPQLVTGYPNAYGVENFGYTINSVDLGYASNDWILYESMKKTVSHNDICLPLKYSDGYLLGSPKRQSETRSIPFHTFLEPSYRFCVEEPTSDIGLYLQLDMTCNSGSCMGKQEIGDTFSVFILLGCLAESSLEKDALLVLTLTEVDEVADKDAIRQFMNCLPVQFGPSGVTYPFDEAHDSVLTKFYLSSSDLVSEESIFLLQIVVYSLMSVSVAVPLIRWSVWKILIIVTLIEDILVGSCFLLVGLPKGDQIFFHDKAYYYIWAWERNILIIGWFLNRVSVLCLIILFAIISWKNEFKCRVVARKFLQEQIQTACTESPREESLEATQDIRRLC